MRPRSTAGNVRLILIASASWTTLITDTLAQQPTELPEIEIETRKKRVNVTNTRLEGGSAPAASDARSNVPATGSVDGTAPAIGGITGASTTVITREQIERAPQASLADIIGREAGVQTQSLYGGVNGVGTVCGIEPHAPSGTA